MQCITVGYDAGRYLVTQVRAGVVTEGAAKELLSMTLLLVIIVEGTRAATGSDYEIFRGSLDFALNNYEDILRPYS